MSIDLRTDDQVFWERPTNSGFVGAASEFTSRAFEIGAGSLFFLVSCFGHVLTEGNFDCPTEAPFDLARALNPAEYIQGVVPGFPISIKSDSFGGMWHFIDIDASINRYNDHRGLFYENAGPSHPGALDVAIMVAADIAGITLQPFESEGIKIYGRFDRQRRTGLQWQAHNLGHVEFSPVSHLARHGWEMFNGADASSLSWPLHAVGDAAAPHHVTGTTGWGHRPFEDAVSDLNEVLLPHGGDSGFSEVQKRALDSAFDILAAFDQDPSIEHFIEREARATYDYANAHDGVFKDYASNLYFGPTNSVAIDAYRDDRGLLQPYVDIALAHTVALLIKASERIGDTEPGVVPRTLCNDGEYFSGNPVTDGCTPGTRPDVSQLPDLPGASTIRCTSAEGTACREPLDCCPPFICDSNPSGGPLTCRRHDSPPICLQGSSPCTTDEDCTGSLEVCTGNCCKSTLH